MKHSIKIFSFVVIAFLLFGGKNLAQSNDRPLLVVSFNMVQMADVGKVNKMIDSVFSPILKELVDEGFIYSYGFFSHTWGDEWNSNIWYTVKDMTSFDKFWKEYVDRVNKRHPQAFVNTTKYFQAHKDNIYTIRGQYPPPQH